MFGYYRQFQTLLAATCTTSATPGSPTTLISVVCYDSDGCCDNAKTATSMTDVAVSYESCVTAAASPEDKLACTDMPVSG